MENKTINQFTSELSSNSPTPSGGGATAVVGAIAASLNSMVISLTVGKKKYQQYQQELEKLAIDSEKLRIKLLEDINNDATCFEPLSKAYSISKDDPTREETMEKCLRLAASSPFEILVDLTNVIELASRLEEIGSRIVISDVATAVSLANGGLKAAAINVKVNTKLMKDKSYANELNAKVDKLVNEYGKLANDIFSKIERTMI